MALSRVYHVRQLNQSPVPEFVGVIARLGSVLRASRNENASIVGLDGAKPDRNVEVDVEYLPLLALVIHVVEGHNLLIELEEVDLVRAYLLHLVLVLLCLRPIEHPDASLSKVVRHCKLRVPVEANVVLVLADLLVIDAVDVALRSAIVALRPSSSIALAVGVGGVGRHSSAIV